MRVGKRVQVVLVEEERVQETSRGAGIDQRPKRYRGVKGKEEMDEKEYMAGLRIGEGRRDWERATQPDP